MKPANGAYQAKTRRMRGFEPAAGLVKDRIRNAGEKRGFAVTRLLTAWAEIVGEELASMTRPVKIGYAKGGFGATLTLLTSSASGPMVQMQLPAIREKVNACYGYAAISRISLTQTAPMGFAEGQAEFLAVPKPKPTPDPAIRAQAVEAAEGVKDDSLRNALENLTQNFLSRSKAEKGKT
ncbi:MAG: hypothetical protein ACJASV_000906 [Pseudorhodobacter sp.]|jgi:hypothetical protein